MKTSTLRPGLLVSLKTSIVGNVAYRRTDLDEFTEDDGAKKALWETERTITDPEEHEKAVLVRSKCRSIITGVCAASTFGLLCPEDKQDKLDEAVRDAQQLAQAFNETAKLTRIQIYVIAGRVAPDDVQAVRAINSEVRDLISTMENGLQNLDVKVVRDAATKAKSIGQMLSSAAQERIQAAVETAREVARRIVKAGEAASEELDSAVLRKLAEQRTAFLDLDEMGEMAAPAMTARAIDLEPEAVGVQHVQRRRLPLELEGNDAAV
jgi:hypothetical protein